MTRKRKPGEKSRKGKGKKTGSSGQRQEMEPASQPSTDDGAEKEDGSQTTKRPRMPPIYLNQEDQDDVIDWYQSHLCLYDKGHPEYKLIQMKTTLWNEKAKSVADGQHSGARLKIWLDCLRTQFGKLSKRSSGSGARVSNIDKWILDNFRFLAGHIYRVPSRAGVDVYAKLAEKHPKRIRQHAQESQSDAEEDRDTGVDDESESVASQITEATTLNSETSAKPLKRKKRSDETASLREKLNERLQASELLQGQLFKQLSSSSLPREDERHQWGQWFTAALPHFHDSIWGELQESSLQLVKSFRLRSRKLEEQEKQLRQAYQQQPPTGDDLLFAQRIQATNHYQSPRGFLPHWQTTFQTPPIRPSCGEIQQSRSNPLLSSRSASVPADMFVSASCDTAAPSFGMTEVTLVTTSAVSQSVSPTVSNSNSGQNTMQTIDLSTLRHPSADIDCSLYEK